MYRRHHALIATLCLAGIATAAGCAAMDGLDEATPASMPLDESRGEQVAPTPDESYGTEGHLVGIVNDGSERLISSALLAAGTSQDLEVRALGRDMVDAYGAYRLKQNEIAGLAEPNRHPDETARMGFKMPAPPDGSAEGYPANEPPPGFDRQFLSKTIADHDQFLFVLRMRVKAASNADPTLRALIADQLIPALEKNRERARVLIAARQ